MQDCKSVNPDEAAAYVAAVLAANLCGNSDKIVQDLLILDVTPLSLGIGLIGGLFDIVIPRNTPIPSIKVKKYYTTKDNQTFLHIFVHQGERSKSTDNHLLGGLKISGIPPAP